MPTQPTAARRNRLSTAVPVLVGLLLLAIPSGATAAPVAAADVQLPTEPMSEDDRAAIDAGIEAIAAEHPEIPAFYIGVWDPERGAYQQAYGLADVANERPAAIDDHFRIGSISKTFGAALILQLVDEGLLSLDDTVADADPGLAERFPEVAEIPIRDLLGMTSGIPDYMNVPDATVAALAQAPDTQWDPQELIGYGIGSGSGLQPVGTGGYSTTNYIILQEIAETLTGQSIQELVQERLTDPLAMPGTALPYNEDTTLPEPRARGYMSPACIGELVADGAEPVPDGTDTTDWNASYGQIGGGMHSTLADLGTWAASMSGSSLLSEELAAQRIEMHDAGLGVFTYGLGIMQFVEGFGGQYGHEGEAIGWEGWAGHNPETGQTTVVFTNTCSDSTPLFEAVAVLDPDVQPLADAFASAELLAGTEGPSEPPEPLQALDFAPFEDALAALDPERLAVLDELVIEATFEDLQAAMTAGELSSVELTTYYVARIRDLDVDGLRSMLELNPDALDIATDLDAEREAGTVRGPLHGIPVSLKGNIATGDAMHTTAGAAALAESRSDRDASVAALLRDAGAVIIGKANLSEWAYWMHRGPSGYSSLGGQVVSPYDPSFDPLGSSTGSAVGTSANLVAASIGTETSGSIIAPAAKNGVIGVHPSLGLVSRDRIIPITDQTDTPGPITRTVADAAVLLSAIAGEDPGDPMTSAAAELAGTDFTSFLDADALDSVRVGVWTGVDEELLGDMSAEDFFELLGLGPALASLDAAGAEVVPVWISALTNNDRFSTLGNNGLRMGFAEYIAAVDPDSKIDSIADVIAFNEQDPERYAPYGQELLEAAAASDATPEEYEALGAQLRDEARGYIDWLLADNDVEVIVSMDNAFASAYAVAGYPAVTVPAGQSEFTGPSGLTFAGGYLQDGEVLGFAYSFEQASVLREAPTVRGDVPKDE